MTNKLSPAAQAVRRAAAAAYWAEEYEVASPDVIAAAALCAAADAVAPVAAPHRRKIRAELLAIATELENTDD